MFVWNYLKENLDREKTKNFFIFLLTVSVFFSLFYLFTYYIKQNSPNGDDTKLNDVQVISNSIKDFSAFNKIDEHTASRGLSACIFKYFKSKADLYEVIHYCERILLSDNWTQNNQNNLIFNKDDFLFHIEYRSEKNADWNFSVSICWKNKG